MYRHDKISLNDSVQFIKLCNKICRVVISLLITWVLPPLIGSFKWLTPPGPYRATTCRGRELNFGSHTYFFDHTRTWRTSSDEGSAQCWDHLRDSTNMKDDTHQTHTHLFHQGEYEMMIIAALWKVSWHLSYRWGKTLKKPSPRKPVPTRDWTLARYVTGAHATTCYTAMDSCHLPENINIKIKALSHLKYTVFRS